MGWSHNANSVPQFSFHTDMQNCNCILNVGFICLPCLWQNGLNDWAVHSEGCCLLHEAGSKMEVLKVNWDY